MNLNYLRIPISYMQDIDDLGSFSGLDSTQLEWFSRSYEPEDQQGILEALRWASQNPGYDYQSLALEDVTFEGSVIYEYLYKWYESLKALEL